MLTLSFLFDNYGLYPDDLVNDSFILNDELYKLEEVRIYSEEELESLSSFSISLKTLFNMSFRIIKNRQNKYLTNNINTNYALIAIPIRKISFYDVIKFNYEFINKETRIYTINQMIDIWLERYDNIQKNCFDSLNNDDINYNAIYTAITFSFGLAENAISYLADAKLDYGNEISRLTLTHIRLNSLDSYSFLNPLNMVFDSIIRDYAELYKFDLIDIQELNQIINQLNLTQKEASLLMARVLYPTRIFDLLEDTYIDEENKFQKASEYIRNLDKELQRIKNIHKLLIKKYNIRPIKWLLK